MPESTGGGGGDVESCTPACASRELSRAFWKWSTRFLLPLVILLLCVWAMGTDVGVTEAAVEAMMEQEEHEGSSVDATPDEHSTTTTTGSSSTEPSPNYELTGRWSPMDVRHASELTPKAFVEDYLKKGVPVVIKGDPMAVKAASMGWNPRRMAEECGDMKPNWARTVGAFVDGLSEARETSRLFASTHAHLMCSTRGAKEPTERGGMEIACWFLIYFILAVKGVKGIN